MKKKLLLSFFILSIICMVACGKKDKVEENNIDIPVVEQENVVPDEIEEVSEDMNIQEETDDEQPEEETANEENANVDLEEEAEHTELETEDDSLCMDLVSIKLKMFSFSENPSIENYVNILQQNNPGITYAVYDKDYYITLISYDEYMNTKSYMEEPGFIEESFNAMFNKEVNGDVFRSMEYDDEFQHITIYVNKEEFEKNKKIYIPTVTARVEIISDAIQAYKLIEPRDRIIEVQFLDEETGEKIELDEEVISENSISDNDAEAE